MVLPLDVTAFDTHEAALTKILDHYGTIDILVSNAGKIVLAPFEEIDLKKDISLFNLNVLGAVNMSRLCVNYWLKNKTKGHLVVTSATGAQSPFPAASSAAATKHAIHGYFDSIRCELCTYYKLQ